MDRGSREVEIAVSSGASAATCLGQAPIETINKFIEECQNFGIDSMIDMMNVPFPFEVLQRLKKLPTIVVLHRGVDEPEKQISYQQIHQIKGAYNIFISVAGGETSKETRRAIFNDADIAVVWRYFYENPEKTAEIAREFLKEIR
jgi:bifunctional enzyme Fae/Hps